MSFLSFNIFFDLSKFLGVVGGGGHGGQDLELVKACIDGDKGACRKLVDNYSGIIYHAINKVLSKWSLSERRDLSEELFQVIFESLFKNNKKKLRSFNGNSKLSTWLCVVTINMTKDYLKSKEFKVSSQHVSFSDKPAEGLSLEEKLADDRPQPPEILEATEEKNLIEIARNQLSPREQIFLNLNYDKGLDFSEIAKIMNTNKNNIYQIKNRVVEKLSIIFQDFYKKTEPFSSN